MARRMVIAGNWKMYKTMGEAQAFVASLPTDLDALDADVYLAVPFTAIQATAQAADGRSLHVGAQNMNDASEGAFTGEIAASMLKDAGAQFVILGHSERRHIFGESSDFVHSKVKRALEEGLEPIVCIGETLEQRDAGETEAVLKAQITESLAGLNAEQMKQVILAYEPVWAIGTGKTATPELAQETHAQVRSLVAAQWDTEVAETCVIQYGGSVKPDNAASLLSQEDIDGVLVGGASLTPESFAAIAQASAALHH